MTKTLLVLGARSDMARACADAFAARGYDLWLAARDTDALQADAQDLRLRHRREVSVFSYDALGDPQAFLATLPGLPDVALCAVGAMGDQGESQRDPAAAAAVLRANFEGPALTLGALAEGFEARGHGTLVGISSVAGERGRASNYVYGAAKAGFTAFLSGLRNRLVHSGVHVVTVLPGFVATRMTAGMDLPPRLTAEPAEVGQAVLKAVERGHNVIYVRKIWRLVMGIICALPEAIFKKTRI